MSQATQSKPAEKRPSEQGISQMARSTADEGVDFQQMCDTVCSSVKAYSAKNPTMMAGAAFLAGFYIGWKVKPW